MDAPFSYATRAANLAAMTAQPLDLLIVGGGITGAGIARDAAMRGLRVGLIDKGDFGWATSSRSSRLVHGGLPYLEHRQWRFVRRASRERRILLRIAPHLVRLRALVFPIHEGNRISRLQLEAGLWLYDLLAGFRDVRWHRTLSRQEVLRAEPALRVRGLKGGARYWEAECDDARLTLANVRDAHRHGALVANYAEAVRLETADGRVRGAQITDLSTGGGHGVRAAVVVNATGPWSDELRAPEGAQPALRPTKGVHVLVSRQRLGNHGALTILSPIDGRLMFVLPWGELSSIGPTESDYTEPLDDVRPHADEVIYLLRSANAAFPEARLAPEDVRAVWAGIRPLLDPRQPGAPSGIPRDHAIVESRSGLLSIVGGTLTTYREMAAQLVDRVAQRLHQLDGRPAASRAPTDVEPLPGGGSHDLEVLMEEVQREGFSRPIAEHLVLAYGSETPAVVRLALSHPALAEPVAPEHHTLRAELVHAIRREMAITLTDLLIRRTHLFYEVEGQAVQQSDAVADLAGAEMGWDASRRAAELAAYLQEVRRNYEFRRQLTDSS